jgi:tyrosyl-tRNA synthetase
MKCIKMLTFLPMDKIEEMENWDDSRINEKKEVLAFELTSLVHGEEEAEKSKQSAYALFSGKGNIENMPTTEITADELTDGGMGILSLLVKTKLAPSTSEARRNVQQGGVSVNDEKITDPKAIIPITDEVIIKKGKKSFHKVILK